MHALGLGLTLVTDNGRSSGESRGSVETTGLELRVRVAVSSVGSPSLILTAPEYLLPVHQDDAAVSRCNAPLVGTHAQHTLPGDVPYVDQKELCRRRYILHSIQDDQRRRGPAVLASGAANTEEQFMGSTRLRAILLTTLLLAAQSNRAAVVTVDESATFQEIYGIGAFARIVPWKVKNGPFYQTVSLDSIGFYDTVFADLSLIRTNIPPDLQTEANGPYSDPDLTYLRTLHEHGFTRFIAAAWTPPAYMKYNNGLTGQDPGDNSIMPEYYDDFGRYVAYFVKKFRELVGVDLYAVCLSNEPLFDQPYVSCSYTYVEMRDMLAVALPVIDAECPSLRIIMPEDTFFPNRYETWANTVCGDPDIDPLVDMLGIHGYSSSQGIGARDNDWAQLATLAADWNKELWHTEQSETPGTWDGAMRTATGMQSAFAYGGIRAWTWWSLMETSSNAHLGLWIDSTRGPHAYAVGHFGRFVRPGSVRIDAQSDDPDIRPAAFRTPANQTVLVLVHTGTAAKALTIQGASSTSFHGLQSTATRGYVPLEIATGGLTLPPRSVTTLVAGGLAAEANQSLRVVWSVKPRSRPVYYLLNGRLMPRVMRLPRAPTGLGCLVSGEQGEWCTLQSVQPGR
ncbi:MAG: hypothetical protein GF331_07860 [Chitinivibrionales bacterium]|nr:hypothetical protein [Chitinivibrionales bacterium]